jgi:hypothetical protein
MSESYFYKKKIFILSQQPWESSFISKHHYAIELSKLGAKVVFFNSLGLSKKIYEIKKINKNLIAFNYKKLFFNNSNFLKRSLNVFLEFIQVQLFLFLFGKPDIVWYFEQNRFLNVKYFRAKKVIFHPVDFIKTAEKNRFIIAKHADYIFSVSSQILNDYLKLNKNCAVINHGVSDEFFNEVECEPPKFISKSTINVGYVGKIDSQHIDWKTLYHIIDTHPNINFVFIGSYNIDNKYIIELKTKKNVTLTGLLNKIELSKVIGFFDVFLTTYVTSGYEKIGSNSHKILEYLSTGKVIVSNYIGYYEKYKDLLIMSSDNNELPSLFNNVIENLDQYNSKELINKRKLFAKDNTYSKQIERIEQIISSTIN